MILRKTLLKVYSNLKFDTLCRARRLWQGSDSNVVLMPCQTKFINYINVFWWDCIRPRRPRGEFSYGVCALNVTGSDTRRMTAWRRHKNVNFWSASKEPKFLDFENQKFHTVLNISKHTRYYVELFQNSILASTRAVFEHDIICFLAKVISEASGPIQVDPI